MVRRSLSAAQAKGLSRHLHANGVSGGDENGPGGHAVLPTEEGLERPQCIAAALRRQQLGAENHLLVLIWCSQRDHLHTAQSDIRRSSSSYSPLLS